MKRIFNRIRQRVRGKRKSRSGDQNRSQLQPRGEQLEPRRMLSSDFSPWHNYALPEDVNNDGEVTLMDAALAHRRLLGIDSASTPSRLDEAWINSSPNLNRRCGSGEMRSNGSSISCSAPTSATVPRRQRTQEAGTVLR